MRVVARREQAVGLLHEPAMRVDLVGLRVEAGRAIGHDVEPHRRPTRGDRARIEVDRFEVATREQRRVDQRLERDRLEGDCPSDRDSVSSAVPYDQPAGSVSVGLNVMRRES